MVAPMVVVTATEEGAGRSAKMIWMPWGATEVATVAKTTVAVSTTDTEPEMVAEEATVLGEQVESATGVTETTAAVATVGGVTVASVTERMVTDGIPDVVPMVAGEEVGLTEMVAPLVVVMATVGRAGEGDTENVGTPTAMGRAMVDSHTLVGPRTTGAPTSPTPATVEVEMDAEPETVALPTLLTDATVVVIVRAFVPDEGMASG